MTKFVALVSGKGGVGKTTSTINLGYALTSLGKKTILLDANLTTPNLALHLGFIDPEKTLNEFLRKESSLQEITYQHDSGINFIPASHAYQESQKKKISPIK
ncbi:MAG: AAA family ATPase [Nanoarchaeota archaeon]|nr:AAA family ATPase [Nanoarchaeota archaeon]